MKKVNILTLLPVFFGFFVMGFVDVVGIATGYYENHTTKEYLVISDLEKAGEFAANLICEWA